MDAMRLLDLQTEYAAVKEAQEQWPDMPGVQPRSLDQIAAEYGDALKAFLAA